jgi:hypothetical protein
LFPFALWQAAVWLTVAILSIFGEMGAEVAKFSRAKAALKPIAS